MFVTVNKFWYSKHMEPINNKQIQAIQKQIDDLKARWPAHSVQPALMAQLDELEEALEEAIKAEQERLDKRDD